MGVPLSDLLRARGEDEAAFRDSAENEVRDANIAIIEGTGGGGGAGRRGLRTVYPPASADAENSLLDRSVAALEKAAQRLA